MPQNGRRKKSRHKYRHEEAMADGPKVTICLRLPDALHDQLIQMQAKHLLKTGEQMSRNTIIVNILGRYIESGRPVQA